MSDETKKQVAKKESTELMTNETMFSSSGFEGTVAESYAIPLIKITQELSPVRKESKPEYDPNAKLGDFYNNATGELLKSIDLRVMAIDHMLFVWKPNRGGLVGVHHKSAESEIVVRKEGLKKYDKEGNDVVDTLNFTCCNAEDLSVNGLFFLSFAIGHFKYGKAWASRLKNAKFDTKTLKPSAEGKAGASWLGVWHIETVLDRREKGEFYTIGKTPQLVRGLDPKELEDIAALLETVRSAEKNYSGMESEAADGGQTPDTTEQF